MRHFLSNQTSTGYANCSAFDAFLPPPDSTSENASMPRSQSLPQASTVALVSGVTDYSTSGVPVLSEREASRLDKFKQLLAGPNTNLGKYP